MGFSTSPLFFVCLMVLTTICCGKSDKEDKRQERTFGLLGSLTQSLGNLVVGPSSYNRPRPSRYNFNFGFGGSGYNSRPSYNGGYHSTGFQGFPGTELYGYHGTGSHSHHGHHGPGFQGFPGTDFNGHHSTGFQGFSGDRPFFKK